MTTKVTNRFQFSPLMSSPEINATNLSFLEKSQIKLEDNDMSNSNKALRSSVVQRTRNKKLLADVHLK